MSTDKHGWKKILWRHETLLLLVLVVEWLLFYHFGTSVNRRGMTVGFGTVDRQFDILRHSCEIGLLALALTPVILTGGIDLSVGSLLGLSAILFGKFWHDAGMAIPVAAGCALVVGALAGGLNAALITKLRIPPLIVTLGTYLLFRGLAEAITHGAVTYTDFPESFLFLGQERWLGLPAQAWLFIGVAAGMWLLVHRTTFGRSFRAIGFAPEGARYAGIPVERRLAMVYVLAGIISALAAIIYTARLGQAKADAGTGYELFAITAVVLGGTSIFGGIGSVTGTLLGVAAIAVLKNGLACLPVVIRMNSAEELSGMMTGALLLLALCGSVLPKILRAHKHIKKSKTTHMNDPIKETPLSQQLSKSGILLLILNAVLIAGILLLFFPLIHVAVANSFLEHNGLDFSDSKNIWALSLLGCSLFGLFGLLRCRRPTKGWVVATCICLIGLVIHGFAGVNFQTSWPSTVIIGLTILRLLLGVLLAIDLWKYLKAQGGRS